MIKTLIKKDLLVKFGSLLHPMRAFQDPKQKKKVIGGVLSVFIFLLYAFLLQGAFFGNLSNFIKNGTQNVLIVTLVSSHTLLTLLIIVPSIISTFYFSNDINIMLPLPIKSREIILSKFISIFIDSLLVSLFMIIPTLLRLCYYSNYNILTYLFVIIAIFLTNMLIISVMSGIMFFLMRYLNKISNLKNKIQSFTLFVSIGFCFIFTRISNSPDAMMKIVNSFEDSVWAYIPQTFFMTKILNENFIMSLVFTLIYSIIVFGIMYLVSRFSEKALSKGIELNTITAKKVNTNKKLSNKKRTVTKEIALKEFKEILRTPIYFFNIMSIGFIIIIAAGFGFFNAAKKDEFGLFDIINIIDYKFGSYLLYEILIALAVGFMYTTLVSLNSSALSSITREGKFINFIKTLPISSKEQIDGRLLASLWITGINLIFVIIVSIVILYLTAGLNIALFYIPFFILVGSLISWFYFSNVDLYIGIKYPFFNWDTPQIAIKGGTNPLRSMIFTFSNGLIIFGLFKISRLFTDNILNNILSVVIVFMIYTIICGVVIYKLNIKTFSKMLPRYKNE